MSSSRNHPGSTGRRESRQKGSKGSKLGSTHGQEEGKVSQMKKVGNFLIDMERCLGSGQYGKVYLSQETPGKSQNVRDAGSVGDTITKSNSLS